METDKEKRKSAIVTGAAKGIGREVAIRLARNGTDIVVIENVSSAAGTVKEIESAGGRAVTVKGDVSEPETAVKAADACMEQFGKIDILVNNAGIARDSLVMRMKKEDWDKVISINLTGTYNFTKAVSKYMIKQKGGRIINITSIVGMIGNPGQANYAASKAGIIGFTKSVARELASRRITVNAVAPGYIETEMTSSLSEKAKEALKNNIPMKRLGSSADVSECVMFLVSEGASYITGQVISVNGGLSM